MSTNSREYMREYQRRRRGSQVFDNVFLGRTHSDNLYTDCVYELLVNKNPLAKKRYQAMKNLWQESC